MENQQIRRRRTFSQVQKLKILSELDSGYINCSELGRKHDIHPVTIYSWKRSFTKMDEKSKKELPDIAELIAENEELKLKIKALKDTVSDLAVDKRILEMSKELLLKEERKKKLSMQKTSLNRAKRMRNKK